MPENLAVASTSVYVGVDTANSACRCQNLPSRAQNVAVQAGFSFYSGQRRTIILGKGRHPGQDVIR